MPSSQCLLEGSVLSITVADTGPGIPKEIEGRLFQSFVTSRKKGGTGLGLAIVKKIVEEHGGTVSVRSSARGAAFTLRLPQQTSPERAPEKPSRRSSRAGGRTHSPKSE